jgi:hypothetical protein
MSLADLDESNAQLELWSHRTGRLSMALYLLLALELELGL